MGTSDKGIHPVRYSRDHPHAYGDKSSFHPCIVRSVGSSPRVWGQEYWRLTLRQLSGIIPTRMGTSQAYRQLRLARQDHPHAYGDKLSGASATRIVLGSSPRVWGQVWALFPAFWYLRIIPTRMGTRPRCLLPWSKTRDHPHAYGDKASLILAK